MERQIRATIELQNITCPGVWLCPKTRVEVTVKCLSYNHITHRMPPKFPISIHKTFKMESTFRATTIEKLHRQIAREPVEISLWQRGQRLAHYMGTLPDLLARHNSAMVQLLMACTRSLRGAIAPRVQLSAKIENVEYCCSCNSTVITPLVLRAQTFAETVDYLHHMRPRPPRQDPVCHSVDRLNRERIESRSTFERESPRDQTYRGNVYCRDCVETLTPTRDSLVEKWRTRLPPSERPTYSQKSDLTSSQSEFRYSSESCPTIHSAHCAICAKYRATFNLDE